MRGKWKNKYPPLSIIEPTRGQWNLLQMNIAASSSSFSSIPSALPKSPPPPFLSPLFPSIPVAIWKEAEKEPRASEKMTRDSLYSGGVAFLPIAPPPFVCCWQISFLGRCCSSRALLFSPPESLGSQRGQSSSSSSSFWRFSPPPSSVSAWGICLQPSSPFSPEKSGACFHFQIPSCSSPSPPAVSGERGEKKFGSFNLNLNIL